MKTSIIVNKPVVLVGMMGSGKSTIGKKLANKLNIQFYDSDKVIEEREGLSVLDIHDYRGEDYFVKKEIEVISEIMNYGPVVLSTGGSSFMTDPIRNNILENSISIWLNVSIDEIYERVSRRNTRPLLNVDNKKEVIEKLANEWQSVYSQANINMQSTDMGAHHIVDSLLNKLKEYFPTENRILKYG